MQKSVFLNLCYVYFWMDPGMHFERVWKDGQYVWESRIFRKACMSNKCGIAVEFVEVISQRRISRLLISQYKWGYSCVKRYKRRWNISRRLILLVVLLSTGIKRWTAEVSIVIHDWSIVNINDTIKISEFVLCIS